MNSLALLPFAARILEAMSQVFIRHAIGGFLLCDVTRRLLLHYL
jgi:hypothetical protein